MTASASLNARVPMPPSSRNTLIAGSVVLLHVAAIYALQTGLLQRAVEVVVPVELLAALVTPPKPEPPPAPPPPKPVELPVPKPVVRKAITPPAPRPAPAPQPLAIPDPTPTPAAPVGVTEPQPAPPPISAPVAPPAPAPAPPAPPAPPKVEMPVSDADYLRNPPPVYPRMSIRLGEEGTTIVRVLIGPDGRPQKAQTAKSSGFSRLDQAAETTAMSWSYVPGKRGGVPEAMWVNVPIKWEIRN